MNDVLTKLLEPVSADKPCGPDLSNDPRFDELESLLKGKPEVDIGAVKKPAEPPDWGGLQNKCVDFLRQSKHLRVAVMECCCRLQTSGLAGFRDGVQFIRSLVEQHWGAVHPVLDPDDSNDPTQRLNILRALTTPRGGASGWLAITDYMYAAPLLRAKGAPPVTFDQIQSGTVKLGPLLQGGGAEQMGVQLTALQDSLEAVRGIDQWLTNTLSAGNTISFESMEVTLKEMISAIESQMSGGAAKAATVVAAGSEDDGAGAAIMVSGAIRTRDDVVRTLEGICDYYRQVEPGSPVPYLLRRAQKLAAMNFVEAMQELNLATPDTLKPSMGSAVESGTPPEESAA